MQKPTAKVQNIQNPQTQQYENSRACITFGTEINDAPIYIKWDLSFSDLKSRKQIEELNSIVGQNIDVDQAIIIEVPNPSDATKLIKSFNSIKEKKYNVKLDFKDIILRSFQKNGKVYISLKLQSEEEQNLMGIIQVILDGGLNNVVSEQDNNLNGVFLFNQDMNELSKNIENGERFGSAILKNLKLEFNFHLHNLLADRLRDTIKSIDEGFLESPPMVFIEHFRNFDIDYNFDSCDKLNETVRNEIMFGKLLAKVPSDERPINQNKYPEIIDLIQSFGTDCNIYVTIQGVGALKVEIKAPKVGNFFQQFGYGLAKLLQSLD